MTTSPTFWHSKTTYAAIAGVLGNIATVVFHHPEYVPVITSIAGLLSLAFVRDTIRKGQGG